jgi:branched-chain amino acid transport system substrate-binding protein
MHRRTVTIGLAALATSTILPRAHAETTPIKIGFIGSMSGAIGVTGTQALGGVRVALDQLGNKLGPRPVTLIVEDDQAKPEISRQLAEKFLLQDKVDLIFTATTSNSLLGLYQPVIQSKTVLISAMAGPSQIAGKECSPYFFNTSWQGDNLAEAMGAYLTQRNIQDVYILAPNYAAGHDVVAGFKRFYKGNITGEKFTPFSQLDFSAELTELRAAKPKAAFAFFPGGQGVQFLKQYVQYGLKDQIPLYTAYTIDDAALPALGDAANGFVLTVFWTADMDNAANKRFVDGFRQKFGYTPAFYAGLSYDAVNLLNAAITTLNGDVSDQAKLAAAMASAKFQSVRGNFHFANDHFPVQDYYLAKVEPGPDGKPAIRLGQLVMPDHGNAYQSACPLT